MRGFGLELKSVCKNFRFVALIFILICLQAMLFTQFQNESARIKNNTIRANNRYESLNKEWVEFWDWEHRYYQKNGVSRFGYSLETIEYGLSWYQYELMLAQDISEAFNAEDWGEYYLGLAKKTFLDWKLYLNEHKVIHSGDDSIIILTPELCYGDDWAKYKEILDVPGFDKPPWWIQKKHNKSLDRIVFDTTYYLFMAEKGIPPVNSSATSPWAFLFNFLRRGLPHVLGIIVLLMSVNLIHRDRTFGSIKSSLQLPKKRSFYLLKKIALGFTASSLIVLIPQFLSFFFLGCKYGFKGLDIPVLLTSDFLNWSLPPYAVFELRDYPFYGQLGLSKYAVTWLTGRNLLETMEFIPLWKFLLLAAVMLALFIMFCSVLALLISVVLKNEIIAQVAAVGAFILGISFNRIFPKLQTGLLDLFTKADVIPILEGSHCSTYLSSIAALLAATILLFALSSLFFKKQDIK